MLHRSFVCRSIIHRYPAVDRWTGPGRHGSVGTGRRAAAVDRPGSPKEEDGMPELTIEMMEGRTLEQKRELVRRLTDVVVATLKVDPASVLIVIHENRRQDKAKGGVLFSDH
jgi:4-oxalocrotonate tautomerase